ncbi:MAG: hypothetical protein EB828_01320 [Nitrosopumilus sp. D6]|nr:MAG: hypothetical protein EB828_01320 [Nitrosopumilus sp. D6]
MATAEQVDVEDNTTSNEERPKFKCEYKIITNTSPKVIEGFRKIGIMLDAELRAEEEEQARKEKTT